LRIRVRLFLALLPVALLTLIPGEPWEGGFFNGPTLCLLCGPTPLADAILNIFLFLPFGWVVGRLTDVRPEGNVGRDGGRGGETSAVSPGRTIRNAVLWSAAISVFIEAVQMVLPGRFSSAADVLSNTLGGGIGAWAGSRRRVPVAISTVVVGAGLLAPALLLAPAPPGGVYYGQWTAVFENMDAYQGQVLDARVGGISVPSRRSSRAANIRQALKTGAPVAVGVLVGPAPASGAPIFSVADAEERQIFMLGAAEDDIFVHLWRSGSSLGLQTPSWWWPGALRGIPVGDTVRITYALGKRAPCLNIQGRTRCLTASSAVGGWSLLLPDAWGDPALKMLGLLWAFLLGFPFGMLPWSLRGKTLSTASLVVLVAAISSPLPYWVTPWWGIALVFGGMVMASLTETWIRERLG
jgi:hypothetical protein